MVEVTARFVIGAIAIAVAVGASFALWERRVDEPILPFDVLRNGIVLSSVVPR